MEKSLEIMCDGHEVRRHLREDVGGDERLQVREGHAVAEPTRGGCRKETSRQKGAEHAQST